MNRLIALASLTLAAGVGGVAVTAAPAPSLLGAPPVYLEVKDWVLACDNTRVCFAKYDVADDANAGGGYLSLARDPGPAGGLVVSLEATADGAVPDPRTLTLDGQPCPPTPPGRSTPTPRPRPWTARRRRPSSTPSPMERRWPIPMARRQPPSR